MSDEEETKKPYSRPSLEKADAGKLFPGLLRDADSGEPNSQVMVGRMYETGYGTEADGARAELWYRRAAYRGLPIAQYLLGRLLLEKGGGGAERITAAAWMQLAAGAGLEPAVAEMESLRRQWPGELPAAVVARAEDLQKEIARRQEHDDKMAS